jgi:3-oxoacyl-[acyl-carrier protein] reductase
MNIDLATKTALVCGASQGLGLAVAKELALLGAKIILLARSEAKLQLAVKSLDVSRGQKHAYLIGDSTQSNELKQQVEQYLQKNGHIHILINNTGGPPSGPMLETKAEDLITAFQAHLITSHLLVQTVVEGMKLAQFGRIVNIVSTSVKEPIANLGISNSVRAAVSNWAKTLANEIGQYGITVNNVLPGYTKTDRLEYLFDKQAKENNTTIQQIEQKTASQIPAKRLGEPSEFGAAVAFLCTPAASYINGINLPVDGGRLAGL